MRVDEVIVKGVPRRELWRTIHENCQPWFRALGQKAYFVYRGTSSTYPAYVDAVRTNRAPRSSTRYIHNAFNTMIDIAGGTANRSNSLFVTAEQSVAESFGNVYHVFPIGAFSYTYGLDLRDWTIEIHPPDFLNDEAGRRQYQALNQQPRLPGYYSTLSAIYTTPGNYSEEKIKKIIMTEKTADLHQAIDERLEIMLCCKQALLISEEWFDADIKTRFEGL